MTERPDAELLRVLREAAERVPAGPVARRIANRDYPVKRSPSRPLLTMGATVTGLVAAGVGLVLALSTGALPAFAGWTATPTGASEAQIAGAEGICTSVLATSQAEENERAEESSVTSGERPMTHDTDWQPILTDTRGPYTAFFFEGNEGDHGFCLSGPAEAGGEPKPPHAGTDADITPQGDWEKRLKPGSAIATSAGQQTDGGEGRFTMFGGLAGQNVTAIVYHLTDGTAVSATISNGYYLVWWPAILTANRTASRTALSPVQVAASTSPLEEVASTSITNTESTTTHPWIGRDAWAEEI